MRFHSTFSASITRILPALLAGWLVFASVPFANAATESQSAMPTEAALTQQTYALPLNALDGAPVSLSELQGKAVYIKFWATWCPLCLAGLEDFSQLAAAYADSDDTVILSVVAPGQRGEVEKTDFIEWAQGQEIQFPVLFDETGSLNKELGIIGYPASVYLDKQGRVVKRSAGDESNASVEATLSSLTKS